jgi:endoglucanase
MLMLPGYAASADDAVLKSFELPDDRNLIVSVHAYTPYTFALSDSPSANVWSADNPNFTRDIDSLFARLDSYFISKGIPVIMGECGARNKNGNTEARAAWARYYTDKGREIGVPCVWWDNGAFTGSGECFGLMDRRNLNWKYPEIVDAFLGKN